MTEKMKPLTERVDDVAYLFILLSSAVGAILYAQHNEIERAFGEYVFLYYLSLWFSLVLALVVFYNICKYGGKLK